MAIKHALTASVPDWTQAELDAQITLGFYPAGTLLSGVPKPSDWNTQMAVTGLTDSIIPRYDSATSDFVDSNLLSGFNSTAPNATIPVASLTAYGAETNIDIALLAKGTGALMLGIPDGTAAGGNKRGSNAIDLQMYRVLNTQVASGTRSLVLGASNRATNTGSVALGTSNAVTAATAAGVGDTNTVSGTSSVGLGWTNNVSGTKSQGVGGKNTVTSNFSGGLGYGNSIGGYVSFGIGYRCTTTSGGSYSTLIGISLRSTADSCLVLGKWAETTAANAVAIGIGVSDGSRLVNNVASSMWFAINSTIPTLYIGAASGVGTVGKIGVGLTAPTAKLHLMAGTATANTAPLKFTDGTLLTTPEEGAIEFSGGHWYLSNAVRKVITLSAGIKTSTTTVANTAVETSLYSYTFAANEVHLDERILFDISGIVSNASAADDYTIKIKLAGTTLHTIARVGGNVTNEGFEVLYSMTIRSTGAGGTFVDHIAHFEGALTYHQGDITTHAIDTTASQTLDITVTWATAKVGNTISCTQGSLVSHH